jgi:Tfp pilus assembly PilM family ATPase
MAVIDIGAETAKLYIVNQGVIHRIYRSRLGSAQCTAHYAKDFGCTFAEAEALKRTLTTASLTYSAWQKIYHRHFDFALREFAKVIAEYQTIHKITLGEVVITGGGALFPNFSQHIANQLSIPTRVAEPFEQVAYPAFMEDTLRAIGPTYTVALGSALRQFA